MFPKQDFSVTQSQIQAFTEGHRDDHGLLTENFIINTFPAFLVGPISYTPVLGLLIAEIAEEYTFITHVNDQIGVIRWGRAMAERGEGSRAAMFREDGVLLRWMLLYDWNIWEFYIGNSGTQYFTCSIAWTGMILGLALPFLTKGPLLLRASSRCISKRLENCHARPAADDALFRVQCTRKWLTKYIKVWSLGCNMFDWTFSTVLGLQIAFIIVFIFYTVSIIPDSYGNR